MTTLLGIWLFSSLIYQGQDLPRPNPNLIMTLNFTDQQTNVLRYSRLEESGFCERTATYTFEKHTLIQKVVNVHPDNADFCSQDTDMQLGSTSVTPVQVENERLLMELNLGDDKLIYI